MESEKMRRKVIYYCAILAIIWWFGLILYITLTKIDAEHTKGLMEIEGMFRKWKTKKEVAEKKVHKFDWLFFKSMGKQIVEVNRVEPNENINRAKNDDVGAFLSFNKRGHLIRNWLSSDDSNQPVNTNTETNVTHIDVAKYFLIRKMRQKIIDIYGDTLTLPVNDSSYIRVRNWKSKQDANVDIEFASKNLSPVSEELSLPIHVASEHSKPIVRGYNENASTAKPLVRSKTNSDHSKRKTQRYNDTKKLLDKMWMQEMKKTNLSNLSNREKIDVIRNRSRDKTDVMRNRSRDKSKNNQSHDVIVQTNNNLSAFVLSVNETNLLSKLSNERDEFIDISEGNVHNELGPINKYEDLVYKDDKKNNVHKKRVKKEKPRIEESKVQRRKFSITIRHNKNIENQSPKIKKVYMETPPPGVDTNSRKFHNKIKRTS